MFVDIYRDPALDKIFIVEGGKGIPRISGEGSKFLKDLSFHRQVDFKNLPTGLRSEEVMASLKERGFLRCQAGGDRYRGRNSRLIIKKARHDDWASNSVKFTDFLGELRH